jgi:hypothetical protein
VLFKSSLPPREREMAILRIGWLCRSATNFISTRASARLPDSAMRRSSA